MLSLLALTLLLMGVAGTAAAEELESIPDAAPLAEAKKLVEEVYGHLLKATSDEDRVAAARVLIMRADETDKVPAAKYVMYDTARSLAVEAGDTESAMDAINGLINSFKDESGGFLGVASASLQALSRKARNEMQYMAVAQAGLAVAEQMIAAEQPESALDLLTRLRNPALRSRRPELISTYKEMVDQLKAVQDQTDRIAGDLKAIEQNPDDPKLNLSVGKYMALYRGDWDKGLVMLAKSSDAELAAAAKADLAGAAGTKAQIAVGDQWWVISHKHSKLEGDALTERSKYWYRNALTTASGIERSLLTKRLEPAGEVRWGDLVLAPGIRTWIVIDGDERKAKPGPIAKEANWDFKEKPVGAEKTVALHFEGFLYSPKTTKMGIKFHGYICELNLEVNGQFAADGNAYTEVPVNLIKGYNKVRGSVLVKIIHIDKKDTTPSANINLTLMDGNPVQIPAERWFHDVTK